MQETIRTYYRYHIRNSSVEKMNVWRIDRTRGNAATDTSGLARTSYALRSFLPSHRVQHFAP